MELENLTPEEFERAARIVYKHAGIHMPQEKRPLLSNRLRKRLRALGLSTFDEYCRLIESPEDCDEELPHFLSAVTTNVTYFFRDNSLWRHFRADLVSHFVETRGHRKTLRIWSAASSTGAEAYTAAIALRESLPDASDWNITIIGSDISRAALDKAQAAVYDAYAVARMPAALVTRWFVEKGGEYRLIDEIRRMVRFQFHNLRDAFPGGGFDLVFLRNVLMYFDLAMKKRVVKTATDAVAPGGFLIVGDVDPILTNPELQATMTIECRRPGVYFNSPESRSVAEARGRTAAIPDTKVLF